jgi:small-conductance mechanosensitive channel
VAEGNEVNWNWFLDQGIWLLVTLAVAALAYWALRKWVPKGVRAIVNKMTPSGEDWGGASRTISRILIWIGTIIIIFGLVAGILPRVGVDISSLLSWLRDVGSSVGSWLGSHGVRLLIVIALAIIAHQLAKRLIPRIVARLIARKFRGGPAGKVKEIRDRFIPWLAEREEKGPPPEQIKQRVDTLSHFLAQTVIVIIWVIAAFMMLAEIGISITPLLATAGIVGIAIGFGAQSLIRDIIGGFFIILEDQFAIGDVVKAADVIGLVEDINLRRTILRDLDGIVHVVPNGEIRIASNYTKEWSRVNLNISVGYGEDLDHVTSVINRVGQEMADEEYWRPLILNVPQVLRVDNFADSGIEIKILGETKPIYQWEAMGELRKRIKKAFDQEGIEIPWPHIKLYFGEPSKQGLKGKEN